MYWVCLLCIEFKVFYPFMIVTAVLQERICIMGPQSTQNYHHISPGDHLVVLPWLLLLNLWTLLLVCDMHLIFVLLPWGEASSSCIYKIDWTLLLPIFSGTCFSASLVLNASWTCYLWLSISFLHELLLLKSNTG